MRQAYSFINDFGQREVIFYGQDVKPAILIKRSIRERINELLSTPTIFLGHFGCKGGNVEEKVERGLDYYDLWDKRNKRYGKSYSWKETRDTQYKAQ
jgi:hypothetical protein